MTPVSLEFFGFLLIVLVIYYALPPRSQNTWLLVASYGFVIIWSWQFAVVLAAMTGVNYALALALRTHTPRRAAILWLGVGLNLLVLIHFKLAAFYVPDLLEVGVRSGTLNEAPILQFLIPLGLSYYVLQAIAYLIDVYRRIMTPVESVVDFALYMAYFPKLIAGPIERARGFLPKLTTDRRLDNEVLARSCQLIVVGLVRKLVLADPLAGLIPDAAFDAPARFTAPELWFFLIAYAFYLYNDFAGYTSIVRGVSGLFGIELTANFAQPFFARTFTEFWNRWHISLSQWLRDYVFFPVSRALLRVFPNRQHVVNWILPPLITMLLSGLWHASWSHKTVLLWGLLHGGFLILERLLLAGRPVVSPDKWSRSAKVVGILVVFIFTSVAWVPFRTGSGVAHTLSYWQGLVDWSRLVLPDLRILIFMLPSVWLDWVQSQPEGESVFLRWPLLARSTLLALAVLAILLISVPSNGSTFVYQGF